MISHNVQSCQIVHGLCVRVCVLCVCMCCVSEIALGNRKTFVRAENYLIFFSDFNASQTILILSSIISLYFHAFHGVSELFLSFDRKRSCLGAMLASRGCANSRRARSVSAILLIERCLLCMCLYHAYFGFLCAGKACCQG